MILSQILFPPEQEPEKRLLYCRGKGIETANGSLRIPAGETVRLDTYFNAFFYGAYLRYSRVKQVQATVRTSGTIELVLSALSQEMHETVLFQQKVSGEEIITRFPAYPLSGLPKDGALFLAVRAERGPAYLHGGCFSTAGLEPLPVRAAAVICTYQRERSVKENLRRAASLWEPESPVKDAVDVLVIDNGASLHLAETPHVTVFPNKNWGGSGGFARGMLEACQKGYTHILLMDDDISFEPETLLRTIQFLRAAQEGKRPLCVGGQMLLEHQPTIQFESGSGYRRGRLTPHGRGRDLSDRRALLENAKETGAEYNAWWYCCIPVSAVKRYGYPLPFFIKTDDVEYGLRIHPEVVLLNGIGVWHMAFSEKYSPHLEYYIKRNELIASALHGSGAGALAGIWKLSRTAAKACFRRDAKTLAFVRRACQDFQKGPEFFLKTDAEVLNRQLLEPRQTSIWTELRRLLPAFAAFALRYRRVRAEYCSRLPELVSGTFWRTRFEIGKENDPS